MVEGTTLDDFTGFIDPSKGSNEWGWGKVDARTVTSLFRVSSTIESLPATFAVDLIVDGQHQGTIHGGKAITLRFPSGTTHSFVVADEAFTANSTRYLISQNSAAFTSNGVFKPKVRTQYLLSLESPVGEVEGGGWYDAGSYANFTAREPDILKGISQLLGVDLFFDYWVDEHGNRLLSGFMQMDSPHTLRATWDTRLADWRPLAALVTLVLVLILILGSRQRRLRKEQQRG